MWIVSFGQGVMKLVSNIKSLFTFLFTRRSKKEVKLLCSFYNETTKYFLHKPRVSQNIKKTTTNIIQYSTTISTIDTLSK